MINGAELAPQEIERRREAIADAGHTYQAPLDAIAAGQAFAAVELPPEDIAPLPTRVDPDNDPIDTWIMTDQGLARWRPIFDHLRVLKGPNGSRVLRFGDRGEVRLDQTQAHHIARLLTEKGSADG